MVVKPTSDFFLSDHINFLFSDFDVFFDLLVSESVDELNQDNLDIQRILNLPFIFEDYLVENDGKIKLSFCINGKELFVYKGISQDNTTLVYPMFSIESGYKELISLLFIGQNPIMPLAYFDMVSGRLYARTNGYDASLFKTLLLHLYKYKVKIKNYFSTDE